MGLKVTNNAFGTLNAGITSSATTIVLTAGQGARFPSLGAGDYFYATLIDTSNNLEIVKVTARSTDTMTVVRGQDGTTARAYSTNDRFELRPTAAMLNEIITAAEGALQRSGGNLTGTVTATAGNLIRVENPAGGRYGILATDSNGTYLTAHNGSGEPLFLRSPTGYISLSTNSGAECMRLDASGRVTMPVQPSSKARTNSSSGNLTGGSWTKITPNTSIFSRNGAYSTSTGRFTAPVTGIYSFSGTVRWNNNNDNVTYSAAFAVNGTIDVGSEQRFYTPGVTTTDGRGEYTSNTTMLYTLNANDYVELYALVIGTSDQSLNDTCVLAGYLVA